MIYYPTHKQLNFIKLDKCYIYTCLTVSLYILMDTIRNKIKGVHGQMHISLKHIYTGPPPCTKAGSDSLCIFTHLPHFFLF